MAWGMRAISAPITHLEHTPISLDPHMISEYALRTTLRMLIAVVISLTFTLLYATAAAKSRKAGQVLIPLLDILQSVPVLGYISFTVTGFLMLFPGSTLGPECAAIFAIFTSQAWNMAFSLYQSLQTVPHDIDEAAFVFRLSGWQKFWKMELPYAMPGLIWNTMMSMSGGWFFVVASEAITVGNQHIALPGVGSYIALAIEQRNLHAIGYAILAMTVVILLYDQFLFRPLVAWSDKFRYEMTASGEAPRSWVLELFAKSPRAEKLLSLPFGWLAGWVLRLKWFMPKTGPALQFTPREARLFDYLWYALLALAGIVATRHLVIFHMTSVSWHDVGQVAWLAGLTLTRVVVLIALASL
ncbi:MAG: ABC transporter permease subunit, partial [Pseudomonadota bacterium]|nr:ABC transporter permease subunit [Pseudomonadota bacterium]